MQYKEKLLIVQDFVNDNITNVEELCVMFDITLEDIMNAFPDKLVKGYSKITNEETDEEEYEGFRVFYPEDEQDDA